MSEMTDEICQKIGEYWSKRMDAYLLASYEAVFTDIYDAQAAIVEMPSLGTFPTVMEDVSPWNGRSILLQSFDISPETESIPARCTCGVVAAGQGGICSDWCDSL